MANTLQQRITRVLEQIHYAAQHSDDSEMAEMTLDSAERLIIDLRRLALETDWEVLRDR